MEPGKWGLVAGCVAATLVSMGVGSFVFDFVQRGRTTSPNSVEQVLDSDPLLKGLNESFPDEYATLRSVLVARARDGASDAQLAALSFRFMRDFTIRHAPDVAAAPTAELREYASAQHSLIHALREQDPQLCAAFAFTGLNEGAQLGGKAEKAMRRTVEAQIRAARAGLHKPIARAKPDPAEMRAVLSAVVNKGVRSDHVAGLVDGGWRRLSATEQCDLGVGLYDAVTSLPAERSAKVTATLVEASAQVLRRS